MGMADAFPLLLLDEVPTWEPFRTIGAIANRAVPQVSPWASAGAAAAAVRAAGMDEALVVDGDGIPLGAVTVAQLEAGGEGAYAGDRMVSIVAVHESVPLSVATSLVVAQSANRIAVVSDGRRAVGMIAAADLLRWKANHVTRK